jgi:hypothetical protein
MLALKAFASRLSLKTFDRCGPVGSRQLTHSEHGRKHYVHFSLLAHGALAMTAYVVEMKAAGSSDPIEPLWRILLSCYQALAFAARLSQLKDRPSGILEAMSQLHAHYVGLLDTSGH